MLDMIIAATVTQNCIRKVGRNKPMNPDDDLLSLGIDDGLIDRLVNAIATDDQRGLPGLLPKFQIDQNVFDISEDSTVDEVSTIVSSNAVPAHSNTFKTLNIKKRKKSKRIL
jgi:hypothetical protein